MDYNSALNLMLNKQSLGIMPGLTRILKLLKIMDNPQDKIKIIHIAGTNGKGTIANTISQTLTNNGYKVGLFTSPWVENYTEQIKLNGNPIDNADFAKYVDEYNDCDATEFELLTAIMYKYFADNAVDYAVVECGLGGLEDATNVEKENISVITSVAVDHTRILGSTVEEIARQKAGIIKDNSTCILYPNKNIDFIFENVCKQKNTRLIKIADHGNFQENNLAVAERVIAELGIKTKVNLAALPARHENINGVIIDGGHNVDAANALASMNFTDKQVALIGMMADKNVNDYLSIVAPFCKAIITTTPNNSRAMSALELKKISEKYCDNVIAVDNPVDAVNFAKKQGLSLVCGSFYLARDIRKELF